MGPQREQLGGHAESKLYASEIKSQVFYEVLYETQARDIAVGVGAQATHAEGVDEPCALVLAQGLRVHVQRLGNDADHVYALGLSHR